MVRTLKINTKGCVNISREGRNDMEKRYDIRDNLSSVTLNFKSGHKVEYYDVDLLEHIKNQFGTEWIVIYWETKSYRDTIRIPLDTIEEIHYTENLRKFADQREDMED